MIKNNLSTIMAMDEQTKTVQAPTLLLETRSGHIIGQLKYTNWHISFIGNGIDEISFDVHKPNEITDDMTDEKKLVLEKQHKIWNNLVDLKIVEIKDFARYEISVSYTDSTETVKSVHGQSLEVELAQLILRSMYINEQDYITSDITEYNEDDYDENGNFIPTVFYNKKDEKHSLLHRVLKDKAPHWSIGTVTDCVAMSEDSEPESVTTFRRTYTADGTSIYDFLTGEVATETNVVFVFDTLERKINCYSLYDCIDPETGENEATTVGEDTEVFISKEKLATEISISSNKDSVKNYIKVEGGDENINSRVRIANVTGDYISSFNTSQLNDMSKELREKIAERNAKVEENSEDYESLYSQLCVQYNYYQYYKSSMMPGVSLVKETGEILDSTLSKDKSSAEKQYSNLINGLSDLYNTADSSVGIAVKDLSTYTSESFVGITNNVEAYAEVLVDSRYVVEIVKDTDSPTYDDKTHIWKGKFIIRRASNEDEYYPNVEADQKEVTLKVTENELTFAEQKIEKALKKGDLVGIKLELDKTNYVDEDGKVKPELIKDYFMEKEVDVPITTVDGVSTTRKGLHDGQSLARLESIIDGYESCISTLASMGVADNMYEDTEDDKKVPTDEYIFYSNYVTIRDVAVEVRKKREEQIEEVNNKISELTAQMQAIRDELDLETYLGEDLYKEFCSYLREDTYTNSNYISDGLTDAECMEKAKELIAVAKKELAKSCVLQRTVSTSLNNLFVIPEFKDFYDKFDLFNYIRVQTDDEILKLRLVQIDYNGDSVENINVTFSDQIETVDGSISDIESILNQASSMATQFSSTVRQAAQGSEANSTFNELYNGGLNAANILLKNSDNNEVTFGSYGLLCKNMDDEGSYGDKQLRLIGNGMYLTEDAWKTVKMAVGQISVNGEEKYGIVADTIIGKLLVGNTLSIENGDSSVKIDASGITIKKGLIQSHDYNEKNGTGSMLDLNNGTFNFGGGSLTWDGSNLDINGSGTFSGNVYANGGRIGNFIIGSKKKTTDLEESYSSLVLVNDKDIDDEIMIFDTNRYGKLLKDDNGDYILDDNGNEILNPAAILVNPTECAFMVTYDGNLYASGGQIGPWSFDNGSIHTGTGTYGAKNEMYFGVEGLSFSDVFKVNSKGFMTLKMESEIFGTYNLSTDERGLTLKRDAEGERLENTVIGYCQVGMGEDLAFYSDYIECRRIGPYGGNYFNVATGEIIANRIRIGTLECDSTAYITDALIMNNEGLIRAYDVTGTAYTLLKMSDSNTVNLGNRTYNTRLYGNAVLLGENSETVTSDERVKKDFGTLEHYESFYMDLEPCRFKYLTGTSDRYHIGFGAGKTREALENNSLTTKDFAGYVETDIDKAHYMETLGYIPFDGDTELSLRYDEFVALNTYMIQKNVRKIESLEQIIADQQTFIASMQAEISLLKENIS